MRKVGGWEGAGREEVKSPLFLGQTEQTLVTAFPELYLECPLGVLWLENTEVACRTEW